MLLAFRQRLDYCLAKVISDSSNDRNHRVVWFRIGILPTYVARRPASPSSKGSNPPETHQSLGSGTGVIETSLGLSRRLRLVR
jgi:hypothetical protein